ncbi:hypothetical protein [Candidatus Binatus sp.]|uniref:hypothetical protein n=1 Tax=Candidatus Binatus sp. TaxID=2811406 RepID=UPI002F951E5B
MTHSNRNSSFNLNSNDSAFSDETLDLAQCLMPEPPTARVRRVIAESWTDRQVHEIAWTAYDTVVGAANDLTNRLFAGPAVGNVLGGAIDIVLRWQRFNGAVAGAFFGALWPAVGLPAATEVEAIRIEVRSMREELRDAVAERDVEKSTSAARKSSAYQFSAWPGSDPAEFSEDVGH